jgi:light-regulated signal transduction histidine kinase (bacteriophytochrome)
MLEELVGESLDEDGRRYLDVILESSFKMKKLIEDLLYFSKIGRSEMVKQFVDLNRLVPGILNEIEKEKHGRDISFNVSTLPAVKADSSMLRIVYTNLILNAVKFTSKREQAVINIGFGEDEQDYILFVQDNGTGFDMNYSSKLFGVFRRLHSETDYEGTGIGLAIVRQIIKKHGGKTWAEGKPERGAIFYFNLPKNGGVYGQ